MGLQDETYSIRLMLTEKKIPELITTIFVYMQDTFQRDTGSGDELFIQGLKVLYQLSKGNYPGQAQITKSKAWENFKKLMKGDYSVFIILFLKQLFEEDPKYLHMNIKFAKDVIEEFRLAFDRFSDGFRKRVPPQAKDLVTLYIFKCLVKLFLETENTPDSLRQSFNLPIGFALSNMVQNFAFPIFIENYLRIEHRYEPKLISKNWKLEDGSFLGSLMMLTGDHIICMTVDFAFSLIRLYNKSCEGYFSSDLYKGMEATIPSYDLSRFKYLFTFSEGIKFKTEILNSFTVFRVFSNCSKIQEKYTPVELATDGVDTTLDYMPDSHIEDVPNMILQELEYLRQVFEQKDKYNAEDLVDYLLRGVCALVYKYCNGLRWFFLSTEKEELRNKLNAKITELKKKFIAVLAKFVIDEQDLKKLKVGVQNIKTKKDKNGNNTFDLDNIESLMMQKIITDPQSGLHGALGESLQSIIAHIELVISLKPKYDDIASFVKRYRLNLKQYELKDLHTASRMLRCEASYLNAVGQQDINYDDEEEPLKSTSTEWVTLVQNIRNYKDLKRNFLKSKSRNKFYELLESKMEDANQSNLVSYCCQALENVSFQVSNYNSLWYSKSALNTIVFLNNTMFWCPNTRKKLFEYLDKYPDRRTRIISNIYKGFRDSFTILVYTPFFTEELECIFSRFYIFGSFIRGICNQNCQEFKTLLGTFVAKVDCPNYSSLRHPVLVDLTNVLIKFFNFSGISFNKKDEEFPSDRLSKSFLLTVVLRCVIDMVTGPCKQNQLLVYNHGSIVWINMFSRVIMNLDSKYYSVMNIILDYLLALIEGKNKTIVKSFSTNFDVPLLYGVMTKLMTYLWRRVLIKRRQTEVRKQLMELKKNEGGFNQGSTFSLQSNDSSRLDLQSENLRNLILKDSSGKPIEKIDNWTDLITMYMNDDFENHIALSCSIKIFIFLSRVSYESKKYQIFFDLKDSQLKIQYVAAGFKEEDIRLNKVILKGKTQAPEENIVYYFMKNITSRVEIKDGTGFSEIFIFPKRPMCFFLRETTKLNFRDTCNIENTEAKLLDMFESFDQFFSEMESSQRFKSQYRVIGKLATDRGFTILRILCYLISIAVNIILLYNTEFQDFKVIVADTARVATTSLSIILILICLGCIILWIMSSSEVAWAESLRKFKAKHPYRNPFQPINLAAILLEIFMRKDVINFMVHFIVSVWGVGWSSLAQSFHLILIVNINETTKYVITAITKHWDQLLATMTLVLVFVFAYSNYLGRYYGQLFDGTQVSNLQVCQSLKGCFYSTLNLGLRSGGGIAEKMLITDVESSKYNFYGKMVFDLAFFLFVNIISLNVIFGIIIDTFSELRTKQRMREWEQKNICDICGLQKKVFEKKGLEFTFHQVVEHNLWDYVFYLVYLQSLDEVNLSGFEHFVMSKFRIKNTAWIPINSTIFLSDDVNEEDQLQKVQNAIKDLAKTLEIREAKNDERYRTIQAMFIDLRTRVQTIVPSKATKLLKNATELQREDTSDVGDTARQSNGYKDPFSSDQPPLLPGDER